MASFRNVDICKFYSNPNENYDFVLTVCKDMQPNICHKCPYNPGVILVNSTASDHDCRNSQGSKIPSMDSLNFWPDGIYKFEIALTVPDPEPDSYKFTIFLSKHTGNKNFF